MRTRFVAALATVAGVVSLAGLSHGQVSFTQIPQLAGGTQGNNANAISADGRYVVGESDSAATPGVALEDGYRFDRTTLALVSMGSLNAATFSTHAGSVSGDGSTVVGFSRQLIGATNIQRGYSWTQGGGIVGIGVFSGTGTSFAYGISANGSTVVGSTTTSGSAVGQSYYRTGGVMTLIPVLAGGGASSARATNQDGTVVVGDSGAKPFRFFGGTTSAIPQIAGAADGFGEALAVNADGSIVVGAITSPTFTDSSFGFTISQGVAFRWRAGVTRALGGLPSTGSQASEAFGVSGNGLVVVGESRTSGTVSAGGIMEAFVWTPRWGLVRLADKLGASVPAGLRLDRGTSVSANGAVIAGNGTILATSKQFAFVATLPYCVGDHNDDGTLQVQDIFGFLNDWFAGLLKADANGSGSLEVQDIFDFLGAWFAGC